HDAELLRTISPLRLADRIDAPVLLVHGAHDTNVPPSESQQLAEAVQAAGGTARCEIVPDEGHEIVQPARRRAAAELVRDWTLAAFAAAVSPAGAPSRTGRRTGPGHPAPPG
ncbi:alpha/beta hydrolase family protein, partial [Arsenicicoccus sp. UBA2120]